MAACTSAIRICCCATTWRESRSTGKPDYATAGFSAHRRRYEEVRWAYDRDPLKTAQGEQMPVVSCDDVRRAGDENEN